MKKLQDLMDEIMVWSDSTFGDDQRMPGMLAHLKKEVAELTEILDFQIAANQVKSDLIDFGLHPLKQVNMAERWIEEIADCMMLLLDVSSHSGITADLLLKEIKKKLDINKTRQWGKPNADGSVEHLKDEESN